MMLIIMILFILESTDLLSDIRFDDGTYIETILNYYVYNVNLGLTIVIIIGPLSEKQWVKVRKD